MFAVAKNNNALLLPIKTTTIINKKTLTRELQQAALVNTRSHTLLKHILGG